MSDYGSDLPAAISESCGLHRRAKGETSPLPHPKRPFLTSIQNACEAGPSLAYRSDLKLGTPMMLIKLNPLIAF